jgi:hypothetical protein
MADREKDAKPVGSAEVKGKSAAESKPSAPAPKPAETAASNQSKSSLFGQPGAAKMQPIASVEATPQATPTQAPPGPEAAPPQQPQPVRWTFNETGAMTRQANFFAAQLGLTEALFSFGNVARDGSATVNIDTKIVLSIYNAKRVLITLNQLVTQYEDRYGRIDIGQ